MRSERDQSGFTLIELMVVVLIVAILLAIAIPTYLGARERANDRAVQSNLRNAHTNELAFYTDHQEFTESTVEMEDMDASLSYTTATADMALSTKMVYLELATPMARANDTVIVGGKSKSGRCFWLRAVGDQDHPRFAENDCNVVPAPAAFTDSW